MFAHFALAAAVLTKVLHVDFLLLKNYAVPLDKDLVDKIGKAKQIALWGLAGLIITGAALVVYGMVTSQGYLNNPKLWVKLAVLTANGYLVHLLGRYVKEQTVLADFSYGISVLISIVGGQLGKLDFCLLAGYRPRMEQSHAVLKCLMKVLRFRRPLNIRTKSVTILSEPTIKENL